MATISTTGAVVGVLTECTADLSAAGRDVDVDDAAIGAKRPVDIQKNSGLTMCTYTLCTRTAAV